MIWGDLGRIRDWKVLLNVEKYHQPISGKSWGNFGVSCPIFVNIRTEAMKVVALESGESCGHFDTINNVYKLPSDYSTSKYHSFFQS